MQSGDEAHEAQPFLPLPRRAEDTTTTPERSRSVTPLPPSAADTAATYEQCLVVLIRLLGVESPPLASDTNQSHRVWHQRARRAIAQAARQAAVRDEWFEPFVRATVYDPDPSFNRRLVEPALLAFGRRRVQVALLDYLRNGTDPERAGAARAWYWTQVPLTYLAGSDTPTPESAAEFEAFADLRREWRETALQVFVSHADVDVRRCILPGLDLSVRHYPEALHGTVAEAIRIARTHSDEYLQHRVEHQL